MEYKYDEHVYEIKGVLWYAGIAMSVITLIILLLIPRGDFDNISDGFFAGGVMLLISLAIALYALDRPSYRYGNDHFVYDASFSKSSLASCLSETNFIKTDKKHPVSSADIYAADVSGFESVFDIVTRDCKCRCDSVYIMAGEIIKCSNDRMIIQLNDSSDFLINVRVYKNSDYEFSVGKYIPVVIEQSDDSKKYDVYLIYDKIL